MSSLRAGMPEVSEHMSDEEQWERDRDTPAVSAPRPGRWVAAGIIVILAVLAARILITNPNFGWDTVGKYLFSDAILTGLLVTLALTAIAMIIGIVLGVLLAVMRMSSNPIVQGASGAYIWFFRGTPILVQLIFWYNLAALFPSVDLGLPGDPFVHLSANELISPWTAAILGLGLNEGAYMAEIVRAGILSVGRGQVDAARALGMTGNQTMRRIVLPQAMRVIVPPTGNETIGMLKMTALVSVISLGEMLYSAQKIYSVTFETIPLLIVVSIWYLFVTTILTLVQRRIERYFGKGAAAAASRRGLGRRVADMRLPRSLAR